MASLLRKLFGSGSCPVRKEGTNAKTCSRPARCRTLCFNPRQQALRPPVTPCQVVYNSSTYQSPVDSQDTATIDRVPVPYHTLQRLYSSYTAETATWTIYDSVALSIDHDDDEDDQLTSNKQLVISGSCAERSMIKPDMQDRHVETPDIAGMAAQHLQTCTANLTEDSAEAISDLTMVLHDIPSSLTAVFDGHGGSRAARYSAGHITDVIAHNTQLWKALGHAWRPKMPSEAVTEVSNGLIQSFSAIDDEILAQSECKPPGEVDGCTALVGLQVGQHLFVANLGDSRAVLSRGGQAVRLTQDHTPDVPAEKSRIEAVGGIVRQHKGVWRLWLQTRGGYAIKVSSVSRALGDIDYKQPTPLMSAKPDVFHWPLHPRYDRFAIYATDGVWGVVSDQQAVDVVEQVLKQARQQGWTLERSAKFAAEAVVRLALEHKSYDDITAVVTLFNWRR